jgi:N-acetylmuramoyl-L-alanine amidase
MPRVALDALPPPYENERDRAVVVGIDHYGHGIKVLSGAINDCELFCRWLTTPGMGGLNPDNVSYFRSTAPGDPIRNQIEDKLREFYDEYAGTGVSCGRRLYLFFAGHGLVPPPPDKSGCALVMADAHPTQLRGLLGLTAADAMRMTGLFEQVMLVMDCCAEISGPAELKCFLPYYVDTNVQPGAYTHIQAAQLNASTAEQQLDDPLDPAGPSRWQGVLTHTLLRALTTAADPTGVVTAASLKNFIEASPIGGAKVESDPGHGGVDMTFGQARGVPVTVTLSNGATRFQVREGNNFSVVINPRAEETVRLAPGQYVFDALNATGIITQSVPVSVREGGVNVGL